jgi:hypothetical protein
MPVSTKIISKMALQIQAEDTYEDDAMFLIPILSGRLKQTPTLIEDESFAGNAFRDVPQRGTISVTASISFQVDKISIQPILEAAMGHVSSGVYTINDHAKKLSVCFYDGVKNNKYANIYIKSLKITGSVNSKITGDMELVGISPEVRDDLETFPETVTAYDEFFHFHEAQGASGYFRVGDTSGALSAIHDRDIEEVTLDIITGFDEQFCNQIRSLTPVFGMSPPSVTGTFRIARYENDTFLDWLEDGTRLQLEMKLYKAAAAVLLIRVPMFILDTELTDDDVTKQNITMTVGRNGIGASYKNTHMAFNSPVQVTVTAS